jgi:hypothetical protein
VAGEDIATYSGTAAAAFEAAKEQAARQSKALFNQYYGSIPNFDSTTMTNIFNAQSGTINEEAIAGLTSGIMSGGSGVMADISRAGAAEEAAAAQEMRSRGFGGDIGGGLMAQRRGLVETMTGQRAGTARNEFLNAFATGLSPITSSWEEMQQAMIQDQYDKNLVEAMGFAAGREPTAETAAATPPALETGSIVEARQRDEYTKKGTPKGEGIPKPGQEKPGQVFKGTGGATWVYRPQGPSGAGWYRKS